MQQKEIEEKSVAMQKQATELTVVDKSSYDVANSYSSAAAALLKEIDAAFDPIIEAAHKAHKTAIEQKKKQSEPVQEVKRAIDAKMVGWYRAEKARVEEAQREADEKAKKEAEDNALAQAELLHDMGMDEASEEAITVPPVVESVQMQGPEKADGVFYRANYSAVVTDFLALVKAVAEGKQPIAYLEPNYSALNGVARSLKESANIPGVRVVKSTTQGRR
jgi:hypothetical protein